MISTIENFIRAKFANQTIDRLFHGVVWSVTGVLLERLMTLISMVIIVRLLEKDSYGLLAIMQSTFSTAGIFAGLGLGVTATKFIAELKAHNKERLGRLLGLVSLVAMLCGLCVIGLLMIFSGSVAHYVMDAPYVSGLIAIGAVSIWFNTLAGYHTGAMLGFESIKQNALGNFLAALIALPASILLTKYLGLLGAVIALVTTAILRYSFSAFLLHQCLVLNKIKVNYHNLHSEWQTLKSFSLPAFLSGLMLLPAHWLCHAMLINSDNGKANMAVIGVANQWFYAVLMLPMAATRVMLPILSSLFAEGKNTDSKIMLRFSVISNVALLLPFAVIFIFVSPYLMSLYGDDYVASWPVVSIIVFAAAFSAISAPLGQVLAAKSKMWTALSINLVWALTYIILTALLLSKGAMGLAIALLVAYILHGIWSAVLAYRLLRG